MAGDLAENIRSYRKNLGLTQEQLAERLGITLGAVSKWERGSSEPDLSYIMDLAELFHISVDALIGYSMRGNDADTEEDRLEAMIEQSQAGEPEERISLEAVAEEYDRALRRFPNHFRLVCSAAMLYQQIGVVFRKDAALRKALELYRHAINLLPRNGDHPEINEVRLRNEIAGCYSALKDYDKAIEEYKKNNPTGSNDARIGGLYSLFKHQPEEGIVYTEKAFFSHVSDLITTMAGYISYYLATDRMDPGIRAAEWTIRFLESLREDPGKHAYVDKIICLFHLALAVLQDRRGASEASEESLRTAVRIAAAFDADPVFTLENTVFLGKALETGVYDDSGPTATDGLISSLEDYRSFVSDAFRKKFDREVESAGHGRTEPAI